ncbi:MAG TPA: amidohydrolase [Nitrososphaerales archaeon]|nr:amidohydrolase [Nitrososphaerales archaeon]
MSTKLLVKGGVAVTMDRKRRVIEDAGVAVLDGKIVAVGPLQDVSKGFGADEVVDARGCIVMPGLICSHTHLYGIALRGSALNIEQPSDFLQILQRVWWPVDETLTNEDAYATTLAAGIESLMNGTTCYADTHSAPNAIEGSLDQIAKASNEVGLRGIISFEATERRSSEEGTRGLKENLRFIQKKDKGRTMGMISLHASFTVSDDLISRGVEISREHRVPLTIHVSEGPNDGYHNMERYGRGSVERLQKGGLLSPRAVLAHCVHLNEREIELVAKSSASIAHNPMSNMLNAVGVASLTEMLDRGVNVGLGNDGYVFDMFENMRAGFLLQRVARRNPNMPSPQEVVEMCTVNAARAYGLSSLGSIEVGKRADIIVVRPTFTATPFSGSVYGYIVNSLRGPEVRDAVVDGQVIMKNRQVLTLDVQKSEVKVLKTMDRLWQRLGSSPPEAVEPLGLDYPRPHHRKGRNS